MGQCATCGSAVDQAGLCSKCGEAFATRTVAVPAPRGLSSHTTSARHSTRSQGRFAPGETLGGRYRIVAMLGKGGMGEVYRADDLILDQAVALKFLPEAVAHNGHAVERFRNEVRTARQVSHPNVCRVYDLGEMEGLYFLSMEYVDGEDLGSLLRRIGRLPADKALEIARKLCAGLAAAHEKGVLHRDLKPANVMLDARGQVLLTDFGLAGLAEEIQGAEVRNGTPAYMAPEQLAGHEVSVRSDIYALGLVLYEIFTGKLPFESASLAELMRAQQESAPPSLTSVVRDLDPAIERVILRCLNPKPLLRPASALAVAAALPGGDPLAAALAAGETPSPEMVAAAGEGEGLSLKIAIPLLAFVLIAAPAVYAYRTRTSALNMIAPEYGPEVMTLKSREIAQKLGVTARPYDESSRYAWDAAILDYFRNKNANPNWRELLAAHPETLQFQYRSHVVPLTGVMIHDDLMTPGVVYWDDPPFEESGMVRMTLDAQGHLLSFERVPPQQEIAPKDAPPPDWPALFTAAGLDFTKFQPATPQWTALAASDARFAWSTETPLPRRVEAATLHNQPVYFSVIQPWTKTDRAPEASPSNNNGVFLGILSAVLLISCGAAALLAAGNLRRQRGDRRGAFRLAAFITAAQLALWICRGHLLLSLGTFGTFIVAICNSIFYGVVMWTVYVALEPYVRRRWPQTLISWSAVLIGRFRDAVVGRDVLIGCVAGTAMGIVDRSADAWSARLGGWAPDLDLTTTLTGLRGSLAAVFIGVPHAIRDTLFFFLVIFLFRALLRNQWLAAAAFAALFATMNNLGNTTHPWFSTAVAFVILFGMGAVVLRWGLLAAAVMMFFGNITNIPAAVSSAWYFGSSMFLLGLALAIAAWAFHVSLGGRKLWKEDFFG
jgi:predicted Ser/Thr protein kinase